MFKGYLKIVILKELNNGEKTGYDIIKDIYEKTDFIKPSPGSVYPILKNLLKERIVSFKQDKNRKVYRLTKKGKNLIKELEKNRKQLIETLIKKLKLTFPKEQNYILLKNLSEKQKLIKEFLPQAIQLKKNIISLITNKHTSKKEFLKAAKIIEETNKKLVKLTKHKITHKTTIKNAS